MRFWGIDWRSLSDLDELSPVLVRHLLGNRLFVPDQAVGLAGDAGI